VGHQSPVLDSGFASCDGSLVSSLHMIVTPKPYSESSFVSSLHMIVTPKPYSESSFVSSLHFQSDTKTLL
jgi:hypothetical protein